ncbi:hypothetical protein OAA06_01085 [bacterium]|nr:hypothetical protein [bacterium]
MIRSKGIKLWIILFLIFLSFSCEEKKVFDILPVFEITKDLSIDTQQDIIEITIFKNGTGYALTDAYSYYKTIDFGTTWIEKDIFNSDFTQLQFFNETNGICIVNTTAYVTIDGGNHWTKMATESYANVSAIDFSETGDIYIAIREHGLGRNTYPVYKSTDMGESFIFIAQTYNSPTTQLSEIRVTDSLLYFLFIGSDKELISIDIEGYASPQTTLFSIIGDVYRLNIYSDGYCAFTGNGIMSSYRYPDRNNIYQKDVVFDDDVAVFVGRKTVKTNLDIGNDSSWNEVCDANGNPFNHNFLDIDLISSGSYYISGDNGLIWEVKLF